jgi:hypothetical protein
VIVLELWVDIFPFIMSVPEELILLVSVAVLACNFSSTSRSTVKLRFEVLN